MPRGSPQSASAVRPTPPSPPHPLQQLLKSPLPTMPLDQCVASHDAAVGTFHNLPRLYRIWKCGPYPCIYNMPGYSYKTRAYPPPPYQQRLGNLPTYARHHISGISPLLLYSVGATVIQPKLVRLGGPISVSVATQRLLKQLKHNSAASVAAHSPLSLAASTPICSVPD